jgi:phosphohistidine phosphatase
VGHNPEIAEAIGLLSDHPRAVNPGTIAAIDVGGGRYQLAWVREPATNLG